MLRLGVKRTESTSKYKYRGSAYTPILNLSGTCIVTKPLLHIVNHGYLISCSRPIRKINVKYVHNLSRLMVLFSRNFI